MPAIKYKTAAGESVPGVTTVLNILAKPALVWWGFEQGQLYERGEIGGLYEKRDEAADAGTYAHLLIENHIKGLPEPSPDGLTPEGLDKAQGCFIAYLDWEKSHEYQAIASECSLVSERHGFGGTIDISAVMGEKAIVDIKTSKGVYFSMKVQVAAYKELWNECNEDKVTGCHILQLSPDGGFAHHFYPSLKDEWEVFLHCLAIYKILKKTKQKL